RWSTGGTSPAVVDLDLTTGARRRIRRAEGERGRGGTVVAEGGETLLGLLRAGPVACFYPPENHVGILHALEPLTTPDHHLAMVRSVDEVGEGGGGLTE